MESAMKPHIYMQKNWWDSVKTWICHSWVNDGPQVRGTGSTPLEAYDDWLIRSLIA